MATSPSDEGEYINVAGSETPRGLAPSVTETGRTQSYFQATTTPNAAGGGGGGGGGDEAPEKTAKSAPARKLSKKQAAKEAAQLDLTKEVDMIEHKLSIPELEKMYDTSVVTGLKSSQIPALQEEWGPNAMTPPPKTPEWILFLRNMVGGFSTLLWVGGLLCFFAYIMETQKDDEPGLDNIFLGTVLVLVVIVTGTFTYFQEKKSSDTMKKFAKMVPKYCGCIRDGKEDGEFNIEGLVPGDLVKVKYGDKLPADIRIIEASAFKVDNSSLTGESEPQKRTGEAEPEQDRAMEAGCLAFFTTNAVMGTATGIVVRTGDHTVIGGIQQLVSNTEQKQTPINAEIERFIHLITAVAVAIGVTFFIISFTLGYTWLEAVIFLIGIIVANVPEGLLATVTVSLTLCALRMEKKNVLVKNTESVETLGSTSCICSDKTGTLTQNKMTVAHIFYDGSVAKVIDSMRDGLFESEIEADPSSDSLRALWQVGELCSTTSFQYDAESTREMPHQERKANGDASEQAILKWVDGFAAEQMRKDGNASYFKESEAYRPANEKVVNIPFNSKEKFSASVHACDQYPDAWFYALKGAPERVIKKCSYIMDNGKRVPMTEEHLATFDKGYEALGAAGERVLGFAHEIIPYSEFPADHVWDDDEPYNGLPKRNTLTFVGLMALIDPPRTTVPDAVRDCQSGGVRVIMVTGDHPITAKAIARNVGIIHGDTGEDIAKAEGVTNNEVKFTDLPKEEQWKFHDRAPAQVVAGDQLKHFTDEDVDRVLAHREVVFARTSPQQKLQIVQGCQRNGMIVAVTGDGVNDSPALKAADIGVAMGIAGSEVSKEAADMILMDDDFSSIVVGVKEGRIVFDNLKKSIAYTLTSNIPEISPFLIFILASVPLPLSTIMILAIDLGTDMYPAISMAYEGPESDIMQRKPRDPKKDRLVTLKLLQYTYLQIGMIQAAAGFFVYFVVLADSGFWPSSLVGLRARYDEEDIISLVDNYGTEWTYDARQKALNAAQTSYFVSIVIVQWADLIICKTRILSVFQQGMKNMVMNRAMVFETALAAFICYVPGMADFFQTQPLNFVWWLPAITFSVLIFIYDEIRKHLMRKWRLTHPEEFAAGQVGLVEKFTYY